MRAIEWPPDRLPALREPGTYRLACGHLLHCRPLAGGALLVLVESEAGCSPAGLSSDGVPVKLSDDPDWPDGQVPRVAILAFD